MIKQKRYEKILDIINADRAVAIDDICDRLDVSKATIRRDLIYLDQQKLLKRTHGGAVSIVKPVIEDVPISLRNRMNKTAKERIAQRALEQITDGSTIYIGSGSTMRELAARLDVFSQLTVVTNDLGVGYEISQGGKNRLIVAGGILKPSTETLIGTFTENTLHDLKVQLAFLSADSVTPSGFMDYSIDEVSIKRMVLEHAGRSLMLCDQSKFKQPAFITVCPLAAVDVTITDGELEPEFEKDFLDNGINLASV